MDCGMPGFPIPHYLWEFTQTYVHESVMPSNHLSLAPTSALTLSQHQSLFSELAIPKGWPRYRSFRYSIIPSNKYTGLIPFRIDWFDLLAVQGTFKSLLQHHSLKASILQCSAFFMVQLTCSYMTTGKTIAFTIWTFVSKVISLLFNRLSRFVIDFFPRSKHLTSWLQSLSTVILEPRKIKSATVSIFSPFIYHEVMRLVTMILIFWMLRVVCLFSIYFIYLAALGLSCGMWNLAPWPGKKLGPPALGVQSLSHWTTRHACWVASVMSDSLQLYELWLIRLLSPWDSPGKNTGVGCCAPSKGSFRPRD